MSDKLVRVALKEETQRLRDQMAEQQAAWQQAEEECGRLRDLLRQTQWANTVLVAGQGCVLLCPLCDQAKQNGHAPDCPIGAELEIQG